MSFDYAFKNSIGSIEDNKVVLFSKSGNETIYSKNITSIAFVHKRNYFYFINSILGFLAAVYSLFFVVYLFGFWYTLGVILVLILAILSAIANYIGHYLIKISINGHPRKPVKVEFSKISEGKDFVQAVEKVVFLHNVSA